MPQPKITTFTLGDFATNCFVVTVPDAAENSDACWIVDCGYDPQSLLDHIEKNNLRPVALLLTHCHSDHIAGVDEALKRFGPMPIYAHEAEAKFNGEPALNLSAFLGQPITASNPDHVLHGGETLKLNGTQWRVQHAPGHSPGSVIFVHDESNQAIVGDTLFAGSIGRYDFPTSNVDDLRRSIKDVLLALPDETTIHPGHGESTTIGRERTHNPFVVQGF